MEKVKALVKIKLTICKQSLYKWFSVFEEFSFTEWH